MLRSRRAVVIVATSMVLCSAVSTALATEVGPNDFRISQMGPDGITGFSGISPAVAYNSQDDLFLVVWYGDHDTDGENEIYGRLIGSDGMPLAAQFRVSDMGPGGDVDYDALNPAVAYNPIDNEFLVVWSGDDDTGGLSNDESEIFGQLLHADTGLHTGANDFRISDAGPPGSPVNGATEPDVVHSATTNQYLVAWTAMKGWTASPTRSTRSTDSNYRRPVARSEPTTSAFPRWDPTETHRTTPSARRSRTTRSATSTWWCGRATTTHPPLVDNERELFGQRLSATGGAIGADDFRITDMGPDGDANFGAGSPAVAHNPGSNEFLVVWEGDDNVATVDEEFEVFGQRLSATGGSVGENDFRISDMGPDGDPTHYGAQPAVAYDPGGGGYLVVWAGDEQPAPGVHESEIYEIFGQLLEN